MFGTPFKQRAHYVFNYTPRYFNERKERLEKLKEKYAEETATEKHTYTLQLSKNSLKRDWSKTKKTITDADTNKRLAIIIAILVGICAYIFELHTLF
ncbi:hypothetical protein N9J39_02975 [Flavicella sp.]|jgi:hypothetical protein|nr:hypothetical protein [Flavicella sp.]MDA9111815.1 hypothetical protein [Flavicella sp.]|tara:strand:- start:19473 stop:19763 length:291 start_codon:yes stop_codon:yes gene_type:complete